MWRAIQLFFFRRALQQLNLPLRTGKLRNLAELQSIGILFDARSEEQVRQIRLTAATLQKQGKNVSLLGFIPKLPKEVSLDFPFFSSKDVSFIQIPGGEKVNQFIQTPFDLLIVTPSIDALPFQYIAACSTASLKTGVYGTIPEETLDFMIKQNADDPVRTFLDRLLSFLQQIECHA